MKKARTWKGCCRETERDVTRKTNGCHREHGGEVAGNMKGKSPGIGWIVAEGCCRETEGMSSGKRRDATRNMGGSRWKHEREVTGDRRGHIGVVDH